MNPAQNHQTISNSGSGVRADLWNSEVMVLDKAVQVSTHTLKMILGIVESGWRRSNNASKRFQRW